jgi:hypothetical protein
LTHIFVNCRLTVVDDDPPSVATLCGSSLERLGAGVRISGELRERGDQVGDRYVQAARAEGRSWTQIGDVLGVSKQAAQQRFVALPCRRARGRA